MISFEPGPIRPPSEAASILLRITRSCHWNRCAFCPVYKTERYSIRKVDEIKRDIDAMAAVAQRILRRLDGACGAGADGTPAIDLVDGLPRDAAVDATCWQLMASRTPQTFDEVLRVPDATATRPSRAAHRAPQLYPDN